ncbi:ABC transporter permease [Candidatus Riflebacteria bacterium]
MRNTWIIGKNTLLDAVRHKVFSIQFIFLLCAAGLFNLFSHFQSTVNLEYRMIQDMGISIIAFFGLLMTLFLGVSTLREDLDRKTAYVTLSLPIGRWEFYLGKFFGTLLATFLNVLIMGLIFSLLLFLKFKVVWHTFFWVLVFITMELAIVTSLVLLFSLTDSVVMAFSFTLFMYIMGNIVGYVKHLIAETGIQTLVLVSNLAYLAIPNFGYFNIKTRVLKDFAIPHELFLWAVAYCLVYLTVTCLVGILIMEQRDL